MKKFLSLIVLITIGVSAKCLEYKFNGSVTYNLRGVIDFMANENNTLHFNKEKSYNLDKQGNKTSTQENKKQLVYQMKQYKQIFKNICVYDNKYSFVMTPVNGNNICSEIVYYDPSRGLCK